jgi:chorismate mutase
MRFHGIRGAITVEANTAEAILGATSELLRRMAAINDIEMDHIASAIFTMTPDLNAVFPAEAARRLPGWTSVPLMCMQEIPVPGALPLCVRVLMLVNTTRTIDEIHHVYLGGAARLRPDLASKP